MAATKGQRIGIWVIAGFMAVGTIGSFAAIVLANANSQQDQARVNELTAQYQSDVAAQEKKLSEMYYPTLNKYSSQVGKFDEDGVTKLTKKDLLVGSGDAVTKESSFQAYYIGWTPNGKIFDSSISGTSLKAPLDVSPGGVIEGWTEGVDGMKTGGVRELTIPSDLAYGESGSGDSIPPNTPLKFIVMIIPTPDVVEMPQELVNYYQTGRL